MAMHGARGVAACGVVLLHASIYSQSFTAGQWRDQFVRHLDSSVPIFFVLSGFLLYSPFVAAHAAGRSAPRFLAYAARRALRIFPGYWTVLLLTIIVFSAFDLTTASPTHPHSFYDFISWTGLFNLWGPQHLRVRPVPQSWTLDVEIAFYVALPLVAACIGAAVHRGVGWLRAEFVGLGVFAGLSILLKLVAATHGGFVTTEVTYLGWPPAYFDGFAIGMFLAVVACWQERGGEIPRALRTLLSARVIWGAWFVLLVGTVVLLKTDDPYAAQKILRGPRFLAEYVAYIGLGALLVAPVVLGWGNVGPVRRLLSTRPMQYLGTVSYGVYLWHIFVFEIVLNLGLHAQGGLADYLLWIVVGLTGSIIVATISWRLIEQPMLALKRYVPMREEPVQPPLKPAPAQV
jgi:peptidoglycan/LPS O-acetylase OafA/YrhL